MDKATLESLLARIDVWLLIFGVIVVVGVAGESFFGIRHWWNSRKLQLLQHAEDQSHEAKMAALGEETARANARAAELEKQAAGLIKAAEDERLARVKIEEKLAPRRLSEEQQRSIAAKLTDFAGANIDLILLSVSSEASILAGQIQSAFELAKLAAPVARFASASTWALGCIVQVNPGADEKVMNLAQAVIEALRSERIATGKLDTGTQPQGVYMPGPSGAPIRIFIGDKP